MRKIISSLILLISIASVAREKLNPWSFYGNAGIGLNSKVTLEGLQMSEDDIQYFKSRGLAPEITSTGSASAAPAFMIGASYHFTDMFRVSMETGSQYVNQSNYHARNFTMDAMFGYTFSPLGENHEFSADLGLGYYALRNNYVLNWRGVDSRGNQLYNNDVPEQRTIHLGNHDVNTLSVPLKLSYMYNFYGKHWIGVYAQGRLNCASDAFCPKTTGSVGVEYRFTLGKTRRKSIPKVVTNTEYVTKYIYVEKTRYLFVSRPVMDVVKPKIPKRRIITQNLLFEINLSELTETSKMVLNSLDLEGVSLIELTGYTCASGEYEKNKELAQERLDQVTEYLRGLGYAGEIAGATDHSEYPDPDWRAVFMKIIRD